MDSCYGKYNEFDGFDIPNNVKILTNDQFDIYNRMFQITDWPKISFDILEWKLVKGTSLDFSKLLSHVKHKSETIVITNNKNLFTLYCNNQKEFMDICCFLTDVYTISLNANWPWKKWGGGYYDSDEFPEAVSFHEACNWLKENLSDADLWEAPYTNNSSTYYDNLIVTTFDKDLVDNFIKLFNDKQSISGRTEQATFIFEITCSYDQYEY